MQYIDLISLFIRWNRWLRRNTLRLLLSIGIVSICTSIAWSASTNGIIYAGVAAGDATETSVILWTRTAQAIDLQGIVQPLTVEVTTDRAFKKIDRTFKASTQSTRD